MNTIELMLEALKARIPCINDYPTMREYIDAADIHNAAIAAGEAELRREPHFCPYCSKDTNHSVRWCGNCGEFFEKEIK